MYTGAGAGLGKAVSAKEGCSNGCQAKFTPARCLLHSCCQANSTPARCSRHVQRQQDEDWSSDHDMTPETKAMMDRLLLLDPSTLPAPSPYTPYVLSLGKPMSPEHDLTPGAEAELDHLLSPRNLPPTPSSDGKLVCSSPLPQATAAQEAASPSTRTLQPEAYPTPGSGGSSGFFLGLDSALASTTAVSPQDLPQGRFGSPVESMPEWLAEQPASPQYCQMRSFALSPGVDAAPAVGSAASVQARLPQSTAGSLTRLDMVGSHSSVALTHTFTQDGAHASSPAVEFATAQVPTPSTHQTWTSPGGWGSTPSVSDSLESFGYLVTPPYTPMTQPLCEEVTPSSEQQPQQSVEEASRDSQALAQDISLRGLMQMQTGFGAEALHHPGGILAEFCPALPASPTVKGQNLQVNPSSLDH